MSNFYRCQFCLNVISRNNLDIHYRIHVGEGLLVRRERKFGGMGYIKTEAGRKVLKENAQKLTKKENRGPRDPLGREEDMAFHRKRKRFCRECRRVGASLPCCHEEDNVKLLPVLAKPPKITASNTRWKEFYRLFPGCRPREKKVTEKPE